MSRLLRGILFPHGLPVKQIIGGVISTSEASTVTAYNPQRKLVLASDGTLYATYYKKLAGQTQIYVAKSVNGGASWIDETLISTYAGMSTNPQCLQSIAIDSLNCLHVLWRGPATGYTVDQIWYAKYDGSWATPVRLSTYAGMSSYAQGGPVIAVDSSNCLHVLWYGKATGYTTIDQIWYTKYTTSWSEPIRISTATGMESYFQQEPSLTIDSLGYLHAIWHGKANGYTTVNQIWYTKYTDSWSTPIRISTYAGMDSYDQYYSCIAIDFLNYLHVVWMGKATGYTTRDQIWYAKYTDSWATPVRISTADGMQSYHQYYPSIATDSLNYVHVMWHGRATGYTTVNKIWYVNYTDSWGTPIVIQPDGTNQHPNIRWSRYPTSNQVTTQLDYVFTEGTASPYNVMFGLMSVD